MAQLADGTNQHFTAYVPLLRDGESGVLVCLMAVPTIWTVLIAAFLSGCGMVTTTSMVFALSIGCAAVAARLAWLWRQAGH